MNFDFSSITGESYGNPVSIPTSAAVFGPGNTIYTHVFTVPGDYTYDCSIGSHAANGMVGIYFSRKPNNCDDISILNLTINSSSSSSTTITACDSYELDGITYYNSGTIF